MEYRKGKKDTLSGLYAQGVVEEALALPSDLRPHYLSLVLRLPIEISQELTQKAIDWTNNPTFRTSRMEQFPIFQVRYLVQ